MISIPRRVAKSFRVSISAAISLRPGESVKNASSRPIDLSNQVFTKRTNSSLVVFTDRLICLVLPLSPTHSRGKPM